MLENEPHNPPSTSDECAPVLTPELGVNPLWRDETAEKPAIPTFSGVSEIRKIALVFTLWAAIEGFLYGEGRVQQKSCEKEEKRRLAILRESETSIICLLCLLNDEHYSASGLVDAMIGTGASADERGNARKRLLTRTLPVIADDYGLLQLTEHMRGRTREYSICRSPLLAEFAEQHLVAGFKEIAAQPGGQ